MSSFDLANPEHAYMFGFIQADGHLSEDSRNRGRLRVELSARDLALLLEFQRICPWPSSVTSRTRATNFADAHASVSWSVHAREFRTALKELGLPAGRKSTTVAPPVAPFAPRDYLRGLIDADGSVGLTGTGKPFVALTTASDALMRFFRDYAQDLTGARRTLNRNARDAVYNVLYSNEEAVTLARDLYYPGCLALPRKQAAALGVTAWLRPPGSRKVLGRCGRPRRTARSWPPPARRRPPPCWTARSAAAPCADGACWDRRRPGCGSPAPRPPEISPSRRRPA